MGSQGDGVRSRDPIVARSLLATQWHEARSTEAYTPMASRQEGHAW
jgi:hypothetical protein